MVLATRLRFGLGFATLATLFALPAVSAATWPAIYSSPDGDAIGYGVTSDAAGNVYVCGTIVQSGSGYDFVTLKYGAGGGLDWARTYNGAGNYYDAATAITVDADGNVFVTGSSASASGSDDFATIKYNSNGARAWVRTYDGPGHFYDDPVAIELDGSGGVYVGGTIYNASYDFGVVKYDTNGNRLWVRMADGPHHQIDHVNCMKLDSAGNVVVAGYTDGGLSSLDCMTIKYSPAGVLQWRRIFGGNSYDTLNGIAIGPSDSVYVTGQVGTTSGAEMVTVCYDSNGVKQWRRNYEPAGESVYGESIAVDSAGNCYVGGNKGGSSHGPDVVMVAYDVSGNKLWARPYSGPTTTSNDSIQKVWIGPDGTIIVIATIQFTDDPNWDYEALWYSTSGALLDKKRYNGGAGYQQDYVNGSALCPDGSVVLTGNSAVAGDDQKIATVKWSSP